jgi:hypothetical protein
VDIPCTGRRHSKLPFDAVLLEYMQFSYKYFILVIVVNSVLQSTSEEKVTRIKIR